MEIIFEKGLVEFRAESAEERAKLLALWQLVIDCNGTSGKLAPVGAYVPSLGQGAKFAIEGIANLPDFPAIRVTEDCQIFCQTCNRLETLHKGDLIPICCGKLMEIVD